MKQVELPQGPIEYQDTSGRGPVLLLLGGVLMDATVWDPVVELLRGEFRCVVPTLPLGAHRVAMRPDADLTLRGFGRLVADFIDALGLRDVTVVGNDHAAALALAVERPDALERLVISSCEAFENYPPGLPGKNLRASALAPAGLWVAMQGMRLPFVRHGPMGMGWLTKRRLPDELVRQWIEPGLRDAAVRRDLRRYAAGARRKQMVELCAELARFDKPTLVVWTPEDRIQDPAHGARLAELLPDARLVEIDDSRTLIMRDQPARFAEAIATFVAGHTCATADAR